MQSNLISEVSGAELSAYLNSYFSEFFNISKSEFVYHKPRFYSQNYYGARVKGRRRIDLNIAQTYLYDSTKNEMLLHISKSLGSNQLLYLQFKSSIANYFLKTEE